MKLSFYGAAREVTGSCYHLEVNGKNIIIDCGMQQGHDEKNNQELSFKAGQIDIVILTHAHIDHSGRIPLMVKDGFNGKIFATKKTCDLITIMLRDSAHIQEMDAQFDNRKGKRSGKDLAVPLYTMDDVEETLTMLEPCNYEEDIAPFDDFRFRFTDAGHLLGSSHIQIWMTEKEITKKIVFSGDIGNIGQPIIRDPQYIKEADYVVMESTYGDRDHEHSGDYVEDLAVLIDETLGNGGNVIIPSFAVGRTQEVLYFIREIKERKLVKSVPDFPVYVDSPLAGLATKIYSGDLRGYADEETVKIIREGYNPTEFEGLNITESTDESRALNEDTTPKIIISSSGMCDAGRIRHHLKHNLWRSDSAVVFVGYQANGTLGRMLLEGIPKVKLFGEEIIVAAKIISFRGLSAHADRTGLLKWIHSYSPKPQNVFIVHGDAEVSDIFAHTLNQEGYKTVTPNFETVYDLTLDKYINEGIRIETIRAESVNTRPELVHPSKVSYANARLIEAGNQLIDLIKRSKGGSNSDIAKLTEQINIIIKKWDK